MTPAMAAEPPPIRFELIPALDVQVDGPGYDFRIGLYEVRNDQFVAFLNDALTNLDNERGHHVYFDTTTGDVYVNSSLTGALGAGSGGLAIKMFEPSSGGQIEFVDGAYQVVMTPRDFSAHPVTGVSWFGAIKFCNWLTITRGYPPAERAYHEGPASTPSAWRPVGIEAADWAVRDLNSVERDAQLEKLGFRLPMDGGVDEAASHGEWYKAATARNGAGNDVVFDSIYGFGRNDILPRDANFLDSGDPFEPGTAPVGFYDSVNLLADATVTADTQNAYGLYDVSGNVWEWMQDQSPIDANQRRNRGGSWRSVSTSLRASIGATLTAKSVSDATGFRIVQRVIDDLTVTPFDDLVLAGPWGGPYDDPQTGQTIYRVSNVVSRAVSFDVASDAAWVTLSPADGLIDPGAAVEVTASVAPACADGLTVGANVATLTFTDGDGQTIAERSVRLTVREPLTLTPSGSFTSETLFGGVPTPGDFPLSLENTSDQPVTYSAGWEETTSEPSDALWLTLDGGQATGGTIAAHSTVSIDVSIDPDAMATLDAGIHTAKVTVTDVCTQTTFVRQVTLNITPLFSVTPVDEVESTGVVGGPFLPASHEFVVSNGEDTAVTWAVSLCSESVGSDVCTTPPAPFWLELDNAGEALAAHETAMVTATVTPAAADLAADEYSVTVRFENAATMFIVERLVTLHVSDLRVEPTTDTEFRGPLAGPFQPPTSVYTLHNSGLVEMSWTSTVAATAPPPLDALTWLTVSPPAGVILDPTGKSDAEVALSADAALLPAGTYTGTVTFAANGASAVRQVTLLVGGEAFAIPMVMVPSEDVQPQGATHTFRIGRFEITNAEFARFLNDVRKNPTAPRGQHLYHDTDSGSVYINPGPSPDGAEGTEAPSATITTLLYDASTGRIQFDAAMDEPYVVEDGFDNHPVVGVSWQGAVKFCNWLTLIQQMPTDARVYTEGPTPDDWRAVSSDRSALILLPGFRLPMDNEADTAAPFNEWHKAASRKVTADGENAVFGAAYGFGRDVLTDADANFLNSGDTATNGTTPVGYFNGISPLLDETLTELTGNGYGVHDLCGNVSEWVHDLTAGPSGQIGATRGGSFEHDRTLPQLRTDWRQERLARATFSSVGFRVAQSLSPIAIEVTQGDTASRGEGPAGGPFSSTEFTLNIRNNAAYTVDNLMVSVTSGGSWLEVDGIAPQQIPPGATVPLPLRLADAADALLASPRPPGNMRLVPARETQTGGPNYDYWISRFEVTNAQFATFLNDAAANLLAETPDVRSEHMYFHVDSGDVYINDEQAGASGTKAPTSTVLTLLYDAAVGRIELVEDTYVTKAGFDDHPVVGVTWFGAIKYCNWLTVKEGISAALRAYEEAPSPNLDGWHPVVVDDATWTTTGLSAEARRFLVEDTIGYRLVMDDEATGASAFNEWHKAATRRIDSAGLAVFDSPYGFGRDMLGGADANFLASGDTQDDGTTPIGFFNGRNKLQGVVTPTNETDNGYGLHDLSGNVAEWTQEFAVAGDPSQRAVRGGSWTDAAGSVLLRSTGREGLAPDARNDHTGFRVVRGTGHIATVTITDPIADVTLPRFFFLDVREPLEMSPLLGLSIKGPYCTDFSQESITYNVTNTSGMEMPWRVTTIEAPAWLTIAGPVADELAGDLPPGGAIAFTASTNESANALPPAEHAATVLLRNTLTGQTFARDITVTVEQPIRVDADFSNPLSEFEGFWQDPFDNLPTLGFALSRCDSCTDDCALDYEVRSLRSWLTLEPADSLTGALPPLPGSVPITAGINTAAGALAIGDYAAVIEFSFIDPGNSIVPESIDRTIKLVVKDPIAIDPEPDLWDVGCELDIMDPPTKTFTLGNHHRASDIGVIATVDVSWIDVDRPTLTVLPGGREEVKLTINESVVATPGEYPVTVSFLNTLADHVQTRDLTVTIAENLCVTPLTDLVASGRVNGSITPRSASYTLTNIEDLGAAALEWEASADAGWVTIDGSPTVGGILADGASVDVRVAIDTANLPALPPGTPEMTFQAVVSFTDLTGRDTVRRRVRLKLVASRFTVDEVMVSRAARQVSGPDHSFMIGTFPVTNAEFVAFLNDALSHLDDERGHHMFFDTTTGDVYVNSAEMGETGADPGARTVRMFNPSLAGQIEFTSGAYRVVAGTVDHSRHPVTGITWYGALKYCNWLTIDQGMLPDARCYTEDTDGSLIGWHPVSITRSDWANRDLNDAERLSLVSDPRGYRLLMDDGYDNVVFKPDFADTYNEWYKVAAARRTNEGGLTFDALYGFGRSTIGPADANYRCSGDPFEELSDCLLGATTPVGFYDGSLRGSSFTTSANANGFGVFDLTGNVYEWLQGRFDDRPSSISSRTIRGGNWDASADSAKLQTTFRTSVAPSFAIDLIGLRVARAVTAATGDADVDGDVDLLDLAKLSLCEQGPGAGLDPGCATFDLDGDLDVDLTDVGQFQNMFTAAR